MYLDDVKDHTDRNDEVLLIKRGIPSFDSWHFMGWNMYRYLEPNGSWCSHGSLACYIGPTKKPFKVFRTPRFCSSLHFFPGQQTTPEWIPFSGEKPLFFFWSSWMGWSPTTLPGRRISCEKSVDRPPEEVAPPKPRKPRAAKRPR